MRKGSRNGFICSIVLFAAFVLLPSSNVKAADMVITDLSPDNNAVKVCADTKLWITFATTPIVSSDSNLYLQICKVSDDSVVYQLQLQVLWSPPTNNKDGDPCFPWPYKINLNGKTLNYLPFAVSGKTLEIHPSMYPSTTRFDYNTAYYVKMTAGFCTDTNGNTSPAITDGNTWQFTTKASAPPADEDYMVALDGSEDFCTLQGATDAVQDNDPNRTLIRLKKGIYREQVYIPTAKTNMTWLGENRDTTIVAAYNYDGFNSGSDNRMIIRSYAAGFRIYNMTLRNTAPDNIGQAEVIKQQGLKCIVKNCKFMSYQDTLCINGQVYFENSYIEGDTDYIWNTGTTYFNGCEIRSLTTGSSYITQPRTAQNTNGLFFVDCNLTAPSGVADCYFGRLFTGYPYAQNVYINCTMPKTLIRPIGWNQNTQADMNNIRLWEYKSAEPNGTFIDVSQRVAKSKQLDDANALWWRDVNNVFSVNPWNPKALDLPTASWQPEPADGTTGITAAHLTLRWAAGAETESHIVYFDTNNPPTSSTEQTGTSFVTPTLSPGITYYWQIDEKNSTGTTEGTVWSFVTSETLDSVPPSPDPMRWAAEPNATSVSTITMTATTATDDSGVEYYFTNITDTNHNSGWQDSNTYTDVNLVNNKTYTYKVKARDKSNNQNETADSNAASATTPRYECTSTLVSDFDDDCDVDFLDYATFAEAWACEPPGEATDFTDLAQLATDWLKCTRNPLGECWK